MAEAIHRMKFYVRASKRRQLRHFNKLFFPLVVFLPMLIARQAKAASVMPFGHDISTTSYTLNTHECTIGLQTVACGISNRLTLGISPWLVADYNMANILGRFQLATSDSNQDAVQVGYFKTFRQTDKAFAYQMDLVWAYYIHSIFLNPTATVHLNAQFMYFRDDTRPFSIRRPWVDRRPLQVNLTALNELHVAGGWYINAELGVIGVVQTNPEYLFAVTFEYRNQNWLMHGGFSQLGTYSSFWHPLDRIDNQQYLRFSDSGFSGRIDPAYSKNDYSIHPEFALQYYF